MGGIQLVHLPIWTGSYVYRPTGVIRYFSKYAEKQILMDGLMGGILRGEIVMVQEEKLVLNAYISGAFAVIFVILALILHPAFIFAGLFLAAVAVASMQIANKRAKERGDEGSVIVDQNGDTLDSEVAA